MKQSTGKIWKMIQLVGAGIAIWGTVSCMSSITQDVSGNITISPSGGSVALLVGGIVVFLFGRIGGWWFHD